MLLLLLLLLLLLPILANTSVVGAVFYPLISYAFCKHAGRYPTGFT
jgi:hypothetical protein